MKKKIKKKKMEHSLDFIIIIFSLVSISYSYYPIIENIALHDTWPIDQTDFVAVQSNTLGGWLQVSSLRNQI